MMRPILPSAVLTGVFGAGYAVFVDWATDIWAQCQIMAVGFVSGFLGSPVAPTLLGRWREKR